MQTSWTDQWSQTFAIMAYTIVLLVIGATFGYKMLSSKIGNDDGSDINKKNAKDVTEDQRDDEFLIDTSSLKNINKQELQKEWEAFVRVNHAKEEIKRTFQSKQEQNKFLDHISDLVIVGPPKFFKSMRTKTALLWKNQMEIVVYDGHAANNKKFVVVHVHYVGTVDRDRHTRNNWPSERYTINKTEWPSFTPFHKDSMVWQINIRHTKNHHVNETTDDVNRSKRFKNINIGSPIKTCDKNNDLQHLKYPIYLPPLVNGSNTFFKPNSTTVQGPPPQIIQNRFGLNQRTINEIQSNRLRLKPLFIKVKEMCDNYLLSLSSRGGTMIKTRKYESNLDRLMTHNIDQIRGETKAR